MRRISSTVVGIVLLGLWMAMSTLVEGRYRRQLATVNIPQLLQKVYGEVGQDKFRESWKEFNSRNSELQDDFLMSDLSDRELAQLSIDFEQLGEILAKEPTLVDLYADFESNLSTNSFSQMDQLLSDKTGWWTRIKKFLYRKLEKLADEIYRKEQRSHPNHL